MSTPLIFKSLELRNFLSFGNSLQTIYLDKQGAVTITGENNDKGGSNGAGKTTIINALCYALYNKPFDNISLQRLINSTNATKNTQMEVRLTFDKDNIEYEVYRARGEGYRIEVKRNGEDITPGKGVYETDDLILDIIGISYELFTKTIIFSGNSPAFLQLPIAQQRNQIEELFNITILSEKAKQLKEKLRLTEGDIKVAEAVLRQQEVAVELHKKHIKEAEQRINRWEANRIAEINEIEETLIKISEIDFAAEQVLHDEKSLLQQRGTYLAATLAPARRDLKNLTGEVGKLLKEQEHLVDAKCPYCTQQYADAPAKLVLLEADLAEKGAKLLEVEANLNQLENEDTVRKERISEVMKQIKHNDLNELLDARMNTTVLIKKLEELKKAENPHTEAYTRICDEETVDVDSSKVDMLKRRLDHQQFLLKLLTDKNSFLRRRIINKTTPFLNGRLNFYTNYLGLPHMVKFDADMSCTVAEFGRELDFGNLSAGEKKRVNTAMSLAFRDVLHHLHAKTNLLIIDELDGQLDVQGIESVVRILKEKSRDEDLSVFVISHHPSVQGRLDHDMRIVKENGFSTVIMR
jgi:DNA repair exonuclease SbcCD ATPase subunit